MERQLFTHEGWDQADILTFIFYDVTTVVDLPGVPRGSKFSCVNMCYDKGVLEFLNEEGKEVLHKFDLLFCVFPHKG